MKTEFDIYDFDIVCDIDNDVCFDNSQDFVEYIEQKYSCELEDSDDRPFVYIGLVVALHKRGFEISDSLKSKVLECIKDNHLQERINSYDEQYYKGFKKWENDFIKLLKNPSKQNASKKDYISVFTDWKINDFYAVNITDTSDRYVLLRVIDMQKYKGKDLPRVYVCALNDFSIPKKIEDFERLIYLPVSRRYEYMGKHDYLHEILDDIFKTVVRKQIKFIGNYSDLPRPKDEHIPEEGMQSGINLNSIKDTVDIGIKILTTKHVR